MVGRVGPGMIPGQESLWRWEKGASQEKEAREEAKEFAILAIKPDTLLGIAPKEGAKGMESKGREVSRENTPREGCQEAKGENRQDFRDIAIAESGGILGSTAKRTPKQSLFRD